MPNHCHVAVRPFEDHQLEDIVGAWKSVSGHQINLKQGTKGEFWQAESFDRIIRDEAHYRNVVREPLQSFSPG